MEDYSIQKEKHLQAKELLKKMGVDWWLTVERETSMNSDPITSLISSVNFTEIAAIIITSNKTTALVGHNDAEGLRQTGLFDEIIGYNTSFEQELVHLLNRDQPKNIAINYSTEDVSSDGLTYGLYLKIKNILEKSAYKGDIISSEEITSKVRGCKSKTEIQRIKDAIALTEDIFGDARKFITEGVTEIDIYNFFHEQMRKKNVIPSWQASQCPGVMVGPETVTGHNGPTEIVAEKGYVMDIDFGIELNEYCSDLQRAYYVLDDGEDQACEEVQKAFDVVQGAIRVALKQLKPGKTGHEIDRVARDYITSHGYHEWTHGLGHQVGRHVHDGGVSLGPSTWGRYGEREANSPLAEGMVFTLEPGIRTSRGYVGQEEVAVVTKDGGKLLSNPQKNIFLV